MSESEKSRQRLDGDRLKQTETSKWRTAFGEHPAPPRPAPLPCACLSFRDTTIHYEMWKRGLLEGSRKAGLSHVKLSGARHDTRTHAYLLLADHPKRDFAASASSAQPTTIARERE